MQTALPTGPILIVDDETTCLELAQAILNLDGYVVLTANTATEGLALAVRERPALILLDLHFVTGFDGIEAVGRLKADPRTARIPVVALTALTQRDLKRPVHDAGFAAYLTKPLDLTTLRETVRRFVPRVPQ